MLRKLNDLQEVEVAIEKIMDISVENLVWLLGTWRPEDKDNTYVYEVDKEVVGYIVVEDTPIEDLEASQIDCEFSREYLAANYKRIRHIAMTAEYQNKGIGAKILNHFKAENLLLYVAYYPECNINAINFYLKHGFRRIGKFQCPNYKGVENFESHIYIRSKIS